MLQPMSNYPDTSGHLNDPSDVLNVSFGGSVGVRHGEVDELQSDDVIGVVRHAVEQLPQVVGLQTFVVADVRLQLGHPILEQKTRLECLEDRQATVTSNLDQQQFKD